MPTTFNTLKTDIQNLISDTGGDFVSSTFLELAINGAKDEAYDWISDCRNNVGIKNTSSLSFSATGRTLTLPSDFWELIYVGRIMASGGVEEVKLSVVPKSELENPAQAYRISLVMDSTGQWYLYRPLQNNAEAWNMNIDYIPTVANQTAGGSGFVFGPMVERLIKYLAVAEVLRTRKPEQANLWEAKADRLKNQIQDKLEDKSGARYVNFVE